MARGGVLRWVRALTLALVLLVSGCVGHGAAGGAAPPMALLVPLLLIAAVAVAPFVERPVATGRVAVLLLVGQGVLHVVLQVVAGSTVSGRPGGSMGYQGVAMTHAMAGGAAVTPYPVTLFTGAHLGMLLTHVVAAMVVGVWLAAGERAVWMLLEVAALPLVEVWRAVRDAARRLAATAGTALAVAGPVPTLRWDCGPFVRTPVWSAGSVLRRGPPRLDAA